MWHNPIYGMRWGLRRPGRHKSALTLDDYINVWISDDVVDRIERASAKEHMSRSRFIREAVCGLIFANEHDPGDSELIPYHYNVGATHKNMFIRVNHVHADELRKFAKSHDATMSAVVRYAIDLYLNGGNEE